MRVASKATFFVMTTTNTPAPKPWHHVTLILPQFGTMAQERKEYWEGKLRKEAEREERRSRVSIFALPMRQGTNLKIGDFKITCPQDAGKGVAVRIALMAYLDWVDTVRTPGGRAYSWAVMIDGTGSYVEQLRTILEHLRKAPVVLGHRQDASGMNVPRTQVEGFENYLLRKKYGCKLPDYQAGIWGFRMDMMQHLPLSARGYGLEFDLAACVVQNNIDRAFAPVVVNTKKRAGSSFKWKDYEEKLRFIVAKLELSRDEMWNLYQSYFQPLPDEYKEIVLDFLTTNRAFQAPLGSPSI